MTRVIVTENVVRVIPVGVPGPAGVGVPTGGTTGQVLAKQSNADYDVVWSDNLPRALIYAVGFMRC